MDIESTTFKNTRDFCDLKGFTVVGKVVKVYDGDTIWIACDMAQIGMPTLGIRRINVRLARINTPELNDKDAIIKQKAICARDYVAERILDKMITVAITNPNMDPHRRQIGEVFYQPQSLYNFNSIVGGNAQINLNDELLLGGHAVPYKKQ